MVYQETLTIQNNKAKRILELCKSLGIEIYDSFKSKGNVKVGRSKNDKINEYLAQYYRWTNLTKSHLEEMFLTPRILLEFDKKDVFGTSFQLNIQAHIENVLAPQIYFIELIINEMKNYKYTDGNAQVEKQSMFQRIFVGAPSKKIN